MFHPLNIRFVQLVLFICKYVMTYINVKFVSVNTTKQIDPDFKCIYQKSLFYFLQWQVEFYVQRRFSISYVSFSIFILSDSGKICYHCTICCFYGLNFIKQLNGIVHQGCLLCVSQFSLRIGFTFIDLSPFQAQIFLNLSSSLRSQ